LPQTLWRVKKVSLAGWLKSVITYEYGGGELRLRFGGARPYPGLRQKSNDGNRQPLMFCHLNH
jgi:hypothetical protein